MTRSEHLLTCLAEECAEVAQRVSKALRFGLKEIQDGQSATNAQRIDAEIDDLISVVVILQNEGILPASPYPSAERIQAKKMKIERFMAISIEQGTLDGPRSARA
jgi:hypothetical protein